MYLGNSSASAFLFRIGHDTVESKKFLTLTNFSITNMVDEVMSLVMEEIDVDYKFIIRLQEFWPADTILITINSLNYAFLGFFSFK